MMTVQVVKGKPYGVIARQSPRMAKRTHKHKKSLTRRLLGLGVLAGIGYAVWRAIETNRDDRDSGWESQPFPFPPQPRVESDAVAVQEVEPAPTITDAPWIDATDGTCPASHPIKAKVEKGIYHEPGGFNYDATRPDRCYRDAAAAEADGLRKSKR
jgi:hypothetical protein